MRRVTIASFSLLAIAVLESSAQNGDRQDEALVQKTCTSCHDMETVTSSRRTQSGWRETVDDMASRGAQSSSQELAAIVRYLTSHFGKLNMNTATVDQAKEFLGLSDKDARAILEWRDRNGKYRNLDQLKTVPGIDITKLEEKKELIAFSD